MSARQTEFEVNGVMYRATRLNAMTQLQLMRRLSPVIPMIMGVDQADNVAVVTKATEFLSALSDDDMEYIVKTCLKSCERKDGGRGHPSWNRVMLDDGSNMYEDAMTMTDLITICGQVISFNLSDLFKGAANIAPPTIEPRQNTKA